MGIFVGSDADSVFQAYKEGLIFKTWEKWTISGNGGNDVLYGGENKDQIYGGTGNDTLAGYGDNDYLSGDVGNDILYGGSGDDAMIGGEGNDYLYGMSGNDAMYGGLGDDIYEIDSLSDGVYENAAQGTDTVYSFVTNYTLPSNVENLYLYETGAVAASGNELNNIIGGNSAANQLYGQAGNDVMYGGAGNDWLWGGAGADTAYGGTGNDNYDVSAVGDLTVEGVNEGTDTIYAYISYTMGANIENLILVESIATAVNATGNILDNVIYGNSLNNTIQGLEGNDQLFGMAGNDLLVGGKGNDSLTGGLGDDRLVAYGGQARETDAMTGQQGADVFVLGSASEVFYQGEGYGLITDFSVAQGDKIVLKGPANQYELKQEAFQGAGTAAQDTLIYKGRDLIGVIQDTRLTFSNHQSSFNFVS